MNDAIDISIVGPAFAAGMLVLVTHVPLGIHVIKRGIIFLDLAIAQIAGLGVLAAQVMDWHGPGEQWIAYGAGLAGALLLYGCERHWGNVQEALIGVSFILAASAGMLVIAGNPQGGEHLHSLLAGQILWVEYAQLIPLAGLYALVLILWFTLGRHAGPWLFYSLFAVAVTASVQLVGVYLVFASLIIPALAVRNQRQAALIRGYLVGAAGYAIGLAISAGADLPAGPVIVWSLAGCALGTSMFTWLKRRVYSA